MERMLVTKLIRTQDGRAELYAKGHRFRDLLLFDLGDLYGVGLDPTKLEVGVETPCRFYALWQASDKLNSAGNAYKDVVALEAIDGPATASSTDNSELLAELRAIRALLQVIVEAQGLDVTELSELDVAFPRYGDGSTVSANAAEQQAFKDYTDSQGKIPQDIEHLRAWAMAQ